MLSGTPLCYQKDMQIMTLQCDNSEADTGPTEGEGAHICPKKSEVVMRKCLS